MNKVVCIFIVLFFSVSSLFAKEKSSFAYESIDLIKGCSDFLDKIESPNNSQVIGYIEGINDATLFRMDIYGLTTNNAVSIQTVCQDFLVLVYKKEYKDIEHKGLLNYIVKTKLSSNNGYKDQLIKIDDKLKKKLANN